MRGKSRWQLPGFRMVSIPHRSEEMRRLYLVTGTVWVVAESDDAMVFDLVAYCSWIWGREQNRNAQPRQIRIFRYYGDFVSGDDSNEWNAIFVPLFRCFAIVRLWSGTTSNYKLSLKRNRQELSYHYTSILASIWNVITGIPLSANRHAYIWKCTWYRDRSYHAISYKSSDIYRNNLFKVRLELIREMIRDRN